VSTINSVEDGCAVIDIVEETADPKIKLIENKQYREVFMMFHKTIMDNGLLAVKEVNDVYEFIV